MDKKEFLHIAESTGALQNGHFRLTSGLHSPNYFQCALMLQYPHYLQRFCKEIVEYFHEEEEHINVVVAPAIGGIVVAQEVGRQLNVRSIFAEREGGKMSLRRGFTIEPHETVLVVEDVVTTGETVQEVIELAESTGAFVVGAACIIDRSGGKHKIEVPLFAVHSARAVTYKPDRCPLCEQNVPLQEPGSRSLTGSGR